LLRNVGRRDGFLNLVIKGNRLEADSSDNLKTYSTQRGQESYLRQASKSVFSLVCPWPFTSWPPQLIVQWTCHMDH